MTPRIQHWVRDLTGMVAVLAVLALVTLFYWPSVVSMAALWDNSSYQHGPLVVLISLAMIWHRRSELKAAMGPATPIMALPLMGLVGAWIVARASGIQLGEHLVLPFMVICGLWLIAGTKYLRQAIFAILLLLTCVPMGELITPGLQEITADMSSALLRMVGIPVFREGLFMSLPGGEFEVAEACGGYRYVMAGLVSTMLFSYLTFTRWQTSVMYVALSVVVFVFGNSLRAFIVMLVASGTDMKYFAGGDHVVFGWFLYGVLIAGLFWAGGRWADRHQARVAA